MPPTRSISRRLSGAPYRAVAIALLFTASACGHFKHEEDEPALPAQIVFINESLEQADVFAVAQGGESVRIGTVQAGRTQTLAVPSQFVSRATVTIVARLLARTGLVRTGPLNFNAGDRVEIRLPITANALSVLPAS